MKKNIVGLLLMLTSSGLYADATQSLDVLKDKIEQQVLRELSSYTQGRVDVQADKIDSRLQLGTCDESQLEVFNPYQTPMLKTNTMGIKCKESNNHWTLYVPIRITLLKSVFVAKHMLMKGDLITAEDVYQTELDVQKLKQGFFTNEKEFVGLVSKQTIAADTPITPYHIELAKLIHKGEQVSIVVSQDNLTISMQGIALDTGARGDHIKVKNLSSKRIIDARVLSEEKVEVLL